MNVYYRLSDRMAQADSLLAPYAVKHSGGLGRSREEAECDTRFPFQRDRDRVIHTQAFRRLKHKCQVFVAGQGDHYRTRITHTIEVAQISRDIARTLGLNEDLAEVIALAHDIGHTPFGHAGEEAMRECLAPFKRTFEHNEQSLRIVTLLESRTTLSPGLNLRVEVLEGMAKHRDSASDASSLHISRSLSLEAQVVNLADEIAYVSHDVDDGLRAGLFTLDDLASLAIVRSILLAVSEEGRYLRSALVHALISDLYASFPLQLRTHNIHTLVDVYAATAPIVVCSDAMRQMIDALRTFLWDRLYSSAAVAAQAEAGRGIIRALFAAYLSSPPEKVLSLQAKTNSTLEEAVKDYIAGMTDPYATERASLITRRQYP